MINILKTFFSVFVVSTLFILGINYAVATQNDPIIGHEYGLFADAKTAYLAALNPSKNPAGMLDKAVYENVQGKKIVDFCQLPEQYCSLFAEQYWLVELKNPTENNEPATVYTYDLNTKTITNKEDASKYYGYIAGKLDSSHFPKQSGEAANVTGAQFSVYSQKVENSDQVVEDSLIVRSSLTDDMGNYFIKFPYYVEAESFVHVVQTQPSLSNITVNKVMSVYMCNETPMQDEFVFAKTETHIIEAPETIPNNNSAKQEIKNLTNSPINQPTNPINQTTNPINQTTNPINQTTNPINQTTNPINQTTNPEVGTITIPQSNSDKLAVSGINKTFLFLFVASLLLASFGVYLKIGKEKLPNFKNFLKTNLYENPNNTSY